MLLILDVDGVLTNGKKFYDTTGRGVLKTFYDRDFTAIKKFKAAGWHVVFLSGDPNVNEAVAKNRKIPFYCNRVDNKMVNKITFLDKLCKEYNVAREQIAYIGDDIFDIDIIKAVRWGFCPDDADLDVKQVAISLNSKGGEGCISELYRYFQVSGLVKSVTVEEVEIVDRNEQL